MKQEREYTLVSIPVHLRVPVLILDAPSREEADVFARQILEEECGELSLRSGAPVGFVFLPVGEKASVAGPSPLLRIWLAASVGLLFGFIFGVLAYHFLFGFGGQV